MNIDTKADLTVRTHRVYCNENPPLQWSVDLGSSDSEVKVGGVILFASAKTYNTKNGSAKPASWFEVEGVMTIEQMDGIKFAVIHLPFFAKDPQYVSALESVALDKMRPVF